MGGQPFRRRAFVDGAHFLPQADACARVVASARRQLHADQVGLGLVFAAKTQGQQLRAVTGHRLAQFPQSEQLAEDVRAQIGDHAFAHAFTGVFTQCVGHLVAHDHGDFIVGQFQLVQNAAEKRNLAAGHAKRVDLLRGDQVHLPLPVFGARVPSLRMGNDFGGNGAQPYQLRMAGRSQQLLLIRLSHHLGVLLYRRGLDLLSRNQLRQAGSGAHLHTFARWAGVAGTCRQHQRRQCAGDSLVEPV